MAVHLVQRVKASTQRKMRLMHAATLPAAATAATYTAHAVKIQMLILDLVLDLTARSQR
jgi:hypothetical protein